MLESHTLNITETEILTVSKLTERIKAVLAKSFSSINVVGEISNFKIHTTGHWYFSLRDDAATVSCACFKGKNASIKFKLEDGMQVVIKGSLEVYAPRGNYSIIVTSIEPVGIGAWQLAFDQLKNKLTLEGLLDPARKRLLPLFPKKIGIVTSLTGAAVHDMVSALRRRNQSVHIIIAPAKVQGEGSEDEIVEALNSLAKLPAIEVILLGRGGGSIEDLWSFNTEKVAYAVANSPIPVISGVGHETDYTICDLVADLRAPTPTAAAELVASNIEELMDKWQFLNFQLIGCLENRIKHLTRILDSFKPASIINNLNQRLSLEKAKVALLNGELANTINLICLTRQQLLEKQIGSLIALNPLNVLKRGFAVIYDENQNIVTKAASVKPGDKLIAVLETGKLIVEVKEMNLD